MHDGAPSRPSASHEPGPSHGPRSPQTKGNPRASFDLRGEEGKPASAGKSGADGKVASRLVLGSADPHGVGQDDVKPLAKRRPALDPIAHLAAEERDLRRRPLPACNTAPATEPLTPPQPPLSVPPVVTSVEQVIPAATLRRVRHWFKQLRRCLRFAELGNHSQARRLRPPDLWLPHAGHSIAATADFNWDLRPLNAGLPAVPHTTSGVEGVTPASDLSADTIRAAAVGFADQAIAGEMIAGISDDSECERGTLLCAPHSGALKLYEVAREKLLKSEKKGWASTSCDVPCWPLRASPYSVVDESGRTVDADGKPVPKFRLTSDLSWPHDGMLEDGSGGYVLSINASMDRSKWPSNPLPRAAKTGEAAAILKGSGVPVKVWGMDGEAYYRCFGRQRAEIWRNGAVMMEGTQLDERCCFGSAADATKCSRASNLIAFAVKRALREVDRKHPTREPRVLEWLSARAEAAKESGCSEAEAEELFTALHHFSVYIDDGTGCSIDDAVFTADGEPVLRGGVQLRRAQLHFETARETLESFGIKSSELKEQPPALQVESLGLEIDLAEERMRILPLRRLAYARKAEQAAASRRIERGELASLLGKLLFAASCYPAGRPWLNAAWRLLRCQFRTGGEDTVLLTDGARAGLRRWASTLRSELADGVPLAHGAFPAFGTPGCGAVYADASGLQGWAAWTVSRGELLLTHGEWTREELSDESFTIAEKELLASTLGLVALAPLARLRFVYSFTDNVVAEAAMRRLTPRSARMQLLVERRCAWMRERGVFESPERITTSRNLWADLGSRQAAEEVATQAAALGLQTRVVQPPAAWRNTAALRCA